TIPSRDILIPVLSGGNASGNLRKSGKDRRFAPQENLRDEEVALTLCAFPMRKQGRTGKT
ncbi:hypothetical protein LJD47_30095, partial [Escherichia coli]|nr:hypothetical protein [Escherichia coli]